MNLRGIFAIYHFEMSRMFRTVSQSIASPVLSTALYFIVFGSAIGSKIGNIDGVNYTSFLVIWSCNGSATVIIIVINRITVTKFIILSTSLLLTKTLLSLTTVISGAFDQETFSNLKLITIVLHRSCKQSFFPNNTFYIYLHNQSIHNNL